MDTENVNTDTMQETEPQGVFFASLVRNNKKIRADRAASINDETTTLFKRTVEDIALEIKKLKRERESMLDLSPTSADSLVLASDFNSKGFVEKDLELGVKIRNLEIKFEIAQNRYNYLFGN